jgi:hypothetical protein
MVQPAQHGSDAPFHHAPTGHGGHGEQAIHCPECGAPIRMRGTTVSAVCDYCESTGVDIELIGKVSAIIDNG